MKPVRRNLKYSLFILLFIPVASFAGGGIFGGGGLIENIMFVLYYAAWFVYNFLVLIFRDFLISLYAIPYYVWIGSFLFKRTNRSCYLSFVFVTNPILFLIGWKGFKVIKLGVIWKWYMTLIPIVLLVMYFLKEKPIAQDEDVPQKEQSVPLCMMMQLVLVAVFYFCLIINGVYSGSFNSMEKKAESGEKGSQLGLAGNYEKGNGVPRDDAKAAFWYRKAADQGSNIAKIALARMYAEGRGVPKDEKEAIRLYIEAQIDMGGMSEILPYILTLPPEQVIAMAKKYEDKEPNKVFNFYSYLSGQTSAGQDQYRYKLASMYEEGIGVHLNLKEALRRYKIVAEHGLAEAKTAEARVLIKLQERAMADKILGLGSGRYTGSWQETIHQLEKDATTGDINAQFYLAQIYAQVESVRNETEAEKWYRAVGLKLYKEDLNNISSEEINTIRRARERLIQMRYSPNEENENNNEKNKWSRERWRWHQNDYRYTLFFGLERFAEQSCNTLERTEPIKSPSMNSEEEKFASSSDSKVKFCIAFDSPQLRTIMLADGSLEALANQNFVPAQLMMGVGLVTEDWRGSWDESQQAERWFQQAAKYDVDIAQFALGYIYEHGLGVSANTATAKQWYLLAQAPRKKGEAYASKTEIEKALARLQK